MSSTRGEVASTRRQAVVVLRYIWASPNSVIGLLALPLALLTGGRVRVVSGVVEIAGRAVATLLDYLPIAGGGAAAITFGHVVIGRDEHCLAVTRGHERVHVRQYEVWGPFFIPAYLLASLWAYLIGAGAYHGNYFERDAARRTAGDHL